MSGSRSIHDSTAALARWIAVLVTLPALAVAPPSRTPSRAATGDRCVAASLNSLDGKARCARSVAAAACDRGEAPGAVAETLAKYLGVPAFRLLGPFRRLNGAATAVRRWCDLTVAEFRDIVQYASEREDERSESREEWQRFTMGDENGFIPPGGLSRALEQRRKLIREGGTTVRTQGFARAYSALPATPAGWTNLTGYVHPVGRVNDLLIHPTSANTMWAGSDGGGIWKTTDGGATWQAVDDFLGSLSISSFAMRPADPSTIYAATGAQGSHTGAGGDGVFKSTDGGTSWTQLTATDPASNSDWQYAYKLAIHPTDSNVVIAATYGGAYITTTGGTDWTKIAAASTLARNAAIHPSNGNLRVIAMDNGTVKIATDGSTYNSYTIAPVSGSSYTRIALAPSDQNIMYALVYNSGTTSLYRSSTGGTSWTVVIPSQYSLRGTLYYTGGIWVDPTNANHIAVDEYWGAVTSDASVPSPVWRELCCGWVDFHGIVNDPGYDGSTNKKVYFFDDGGLYRWIDVDTVDTISPAYLSPNGIPVTEAYSVAGRGGNVTFGAQDVASRYYRTTPADPTQKWRAANLCCHDGAATAADRTNPNTLYGSTQYLGIHRSLDGGATNGFICYGITDIVCGNYRGSSMFIAPFVLDPNNQSRMLAGSASLWRSNDVSSGTPPSWSAIHSGTGSRVMAIAVAPTDSNVIWVAYQNGTVFKTANGTDATPSWAQVTNVPVGNKLRIHIDRTNASRVYVGLSGFSANRLVVTPDGGTTWSAVAGLPSASVFAIQQHPARSSWLYVGTAVGLFASEDGGTTWSATNQGPANVQTRDLQWYSDSPAVLLIATFGRGIWRATIDSIAAPTGLTATATGTTSISLSWNAVDGATGYKIYRSSSYPTFSPIGPATVATTTHNDDALPGVGYLYTVRATDGTNDSSDSNSDLATTVVFTDGALVPGTTPARAAHFTELRTAVNAVRTLAVLTNATFTDSPLSSSEAVRALHVSELRAALDEARTKLLLTPLSYTDPTITPGDTAVQGAHVDELRQGVR